MMQNNKKILMIGITGGIGTGKTKVLTYLEDNYRCKIIQADVIANMLKKQGEICYEPTVALLGTEILNDDGSIDNKKMGEIIFSSPVLLKKINDIIHPAVKSRLLAIYEEEKRKKEIDFLFIEAALLVEAGYKNMLDEMWYVYAEDTVRRARLKESRGYEEQKINRIVALQSKKDEFEAACDFLIDNNGLWKETEKQIIKKMEGYSWKKK